MVKFLSFILIILMLSMAGDTVKTYLGPKPAYIINCYHGGILFLNKSCTVRLTSTVEDPDSYLSLFEELKTASKNDRFTFVLVGYGGSTMTLEALGRAITVSKADTTMEIIGDVYSADAFLALFGKHHVLYQHTLFMFHKAKLFKKESDGSEELVKSLDPQEQAWLNEVNTQIMLIYGKKLHQIMTEEQWKNFCDGKDVFVTSEQIAPYLSP